VTGKLEDKRLLRRTRRRWMATVKWIFKEYDCGVEGRGGVVHSIHMDFKFI